MVDDKNIKKNQRKKKILCIKKRNFDTKNIKIE